MTTFRFKVFRVCCSKLLSERTFPFNFLAENLAGSYGAIRTANFWLRHGAAGAGSGLAGELD